jgi:DNA-directed RNA polymerase sigma subunit (sigma70/sigma32)
MDKRLEKLLNENLEEFLQEISRVDLLTREEELTFITAAQEKGLECEEAEWLEKANLRFVVSLVRQYKNRGLSVETLISIGAEELRKSILSYDLDGDTKFTTHFVAQLRGCFEEAIGKINGSNKEKVTLT